MSTSRHFLFAFQKHPKNSSKAQKNFLEVFINQADFRNSSFSRIVCDEKNSKMASN